jgi:hypothetical protein
LGAALGYWTLLYGFISFWNPFVHMWSCHLTQMLQLKYL